MTRITASLITGYDIGLLTQNIYDLAFRFHQLPRIDSRNTLHATSLDYGLDAYGWPVPSWGRKVYPGMGLMTGHGGRPIIQYD